MTSLADSSQSNDVLQETATRLINSLGPDSAIYICRSNYWSGVLRLVLAYKDSLGENS